MNPEIIELAKQLMQQNPGVSPEEAIKEATRMSQGEQSEGFTGGQAREAGRMGQMAQQQYQQRQQQQPQQRPPQRPQVQPGLLGGGQPTPQGQAPHPGIQPQQRPQQQGGMSAQACAAMGGSVQGQSCVISITL